MITLRRPRAVIRQFDPNQDYWNDAMLVVDEKGRVELETYWRNPELAGIWLFRYKVRAACFEELKRQELIERLPGDRESYTLSEKGRQRLG